MSDFVPNSFQTPNAVVDELWLYLEPNEKDLLVIAIRHILGWQENISTRTARISTSKFLRYTTMGRNTVLATLDHLHQLGILRRVGEATSKGQRWKLTIDQENAIQWDVLKARLEEKQTVNAQRAKLMRESGSKKATGLDTKPVSPPNRYRFRHQTNIGLAIKQSQTHISKPKKKTQTTSPADAGEEAGNPPTANEDRLPVKDAPHLYTVTEIQKLKLSRSDWELLLRNERLGLGKYGTRSSVVAHVEAKLALPVMEPLLDEMLVAVDAATIQSIDDPGMRGQFVRYIRNTLWVGETPYTPAEVTRFAAECGPVENLYHLAGRLSKWRSAKRKNVKRGDEADNGKRYERPKQQQLTDAEYAALAAKYAPPS